MDRNIYNVGDISTFFSGANTSSGFVSFYDRIFPESALSGLFIIKGGAGTGKSTFMRRLGEVASNKGYVCERYLCGSDPDSLDGVIIEHNSRKIGVIDGTPPHPKEFRSPGAAGDFLNFGQFWDSNMLRENRREIDEIGRDKGSQYQIAYRYLGAAKNIEKHISSLAEKTYLRDKAITFATKFISSFGIRGSVRTEVISAYTMKGYVSLNFQYPDERLYLLEGKEEVSKLFLRDIENIIKKNEISAVVFKSPLDLKSVEGVYFPESKVRLMISNNLEEKFEKIINMRRFIDKDEAALCRQRSRFGLKCRESLINGAIEALSAAKKYHFLLEDIYKRCMNFDALEEQSDLWYKEILSLLD